MIAQRVTVHVLAPVAGIILGILRYDASHPLAVTLTLHVNLDDFADESPIVWTFARSLLRAGLVSSSGIGDIQVTPMRMSSGRIIVLDIAGIDELQQESFMVLSISWDIISDFLIRTYNEVPLGSEHELVEDSVNNMIKQILGA